MNLPPLPARFRPGWRGLLIAAVLVTVVGEKWDLVHHYGTDIPYGDQWYGELATLYLPWVIGEFTFSDLFAGHNEHRIVLTRLLNLGLLELNGQWDPRLQLVVNALFAALAVAAFTAFTLHAQSRPLGALTALVALRFFTSSSLWENTLNGFQSQFYLLILCSTLHILLTVQARAFSRLWWLGQGAGAAGLLCLALGFIGPLAVLLWLGWRRFRCGQREPDDTTLIIWNALLFVAGVLLINFQERPAEFGSTNWVQFPRILLHVFSWPHWDWKVGIMAQLPLLVFLGWTFARPRREPTEDRLVVLGIFSLLLAGAIAYARGGLGSRHADLLAIGVVANLLCWFALPATGRQQSLKVALASVWLGWTLNGLMRLEQVSMSDTLQHRAELNVSRVSSLRGYFATGQTDWLEKNPDYSVLDIASIARGWAEPRVRNLLPLSIRDPLEPISRVGTSVHLVHRPALPGLPDHVETWGTLTLDGQVAAQEWRRYYPAASLPYVTVFVAGTIAPSVASIELLPKDGRKIEPLQTTLGASSRWRRLNFRNPGGTFALIARTDKEGLGLAMSDPFEVGTFSRLAGKLPEIGRLLSLAGWISCVLLCAWSLFAWLRDDPERKRQG